MSFFGIQLQKCPFLLLALLAPALLSAQTTTVNVNSSVIQSPVKRFGINLGTPNFFDSGQITKNLVFTNPSFEGEIYQSTIECAVASANSCTDANAYSGYPGGFWNYATYTVISGSAVGRTGQVCSFTAPSYPLGGTFTFCNPGTAPSQNDYIVVKTTLAPNVGWPDGDWLTVVGSGSLSADTTDLPPGTLGKQSALLTASTGNDSIGLNMFFDSTAAKSFVQLNGPFQLTFLAKGVSGNQNIAISLTRGTTTFISQTVTLTNSWAPYTVNFTGTENGSALGKVKLSFTAVGPDTVELDDVSLMKTGTDPTNTTVFRDEVVQAFQNAKPGVMRYWVDQLGESLDNLITAPTGRQRSGYTPYPGFDGTEIIDNNSVGTFQTQTVKVGLTDFLLLCQKVGADPWIVVPSTFSTGEAYGLVDYLAGSSATHYGGIRAAAGQTAPWTSVFNVIHLEFGNEEWNGGTFKGGAIENGAAYGQAASAIFTAIKNNPSYVHSSFDLIVDGQSTNPGGNQLIQQNISNNDSFSIAPYMMYNINEWATTDHLFGTTFAEAEAFVTPGASAEGVSNGFILAEQNPASGPGKPIVTSEMNLSPTGDPPSGGDGPLTQAAMNGYASSVAGGVAVLDSMFQQLRAGVLTQNLFALPGYTVSTATGTQAYLYGAVVDMGVTNLKRPQYLALQLANEAIGSNTQMLQTTQTGTNPTDSQYSFGLNSVTLPTMHFIQSFAFSGSGTNSVVVFNVSPDFAEPVNFAGSNAPTGTVNIQQLTSANPTDNNETSAVVVPTSTTVSNFNPANTISLPPYSMTVFTWGNLSQSSQTITFGTIGAQTVGTPLTLMATASSGLSVTYASSTPSVCTVSGSVATFLAPGTCTLTASQAGNSNYSAATPVMQSFSVTSAVAQSQTITFGAIPTQTIGASLTLMASATSGLPVSYSSTTPSICSVSGSTPTLLAAGTCSITASQAGNSSFAAATPVTQSFTVVLKSQTITFGAIAAQVVGTPLTLSATATSTLAVSYSSSTTTVCTVSGGVVTFLAPGTCSITASQAGNTTYAAATPVMQSFSVTAAAGQSQTITFGAIGTQTVGTPLSLSASATSGLAVSFSSNTTTVCTISGSSATFLTAGTCSITALQTGNATYAAATPVTQSFSVVLKSQTITFGTIGTQLVGTPLTLAATSSSGLAVSYSSSTTTVCTLSGSTATFLMNGTCSITASQAGNATYAAATPVTQTFSVGGTQAQTINFGSIAQQTVGTPLNLSASATSGLPVSLSSSTASVCTVAGTTATFAAGGTCSITASQPGNATYAAATPVTQSFSVVGPQSITFGTIATQTVGTPLTLTATASSGLAVSYASTTTSVCTVANNSATFLTGGTCSITASQPGNATFAAATPVTQSFSVLKGQTITFGTIANQNVGTTLALTATSSSGLVVTYSTSTTAICTVAGSTATLAASGTCTITASQPGNATYAAASPVTQSFTVGTPNAPFVGYLAYWGISNTGIYISWSTDVAATTQLAYGTTTALGQLSPLQSALTASHGVVLTTLNPGTTYYFVAQSTNASGVTGYSTQYTFTTTGTATTPAPMISAVVPTSITGTSAIITWTTDQPSSSQVNYGTTTSYGLSSPASTALVTAHSVTLSGLTAGTVYDFDVVSANSSSIASTSANYTFTTTASAPTTPVISAVATSGLTSTSVTVTWTTDQAASSLVNYGTSTAYGSSSTLNTSPVTSHSVTLTGLTAGTTYDFDVVSANSSSLSATSMNSTFTTPTSSGPAPYVGYLAYWGISNTGIYISWSTDVAATTQLAYGTTNSLGQFSPLQTTLSASHGVVLTTLNPGTMYYFVAQSTNAAGVTGYSATYSFMTTGTASTPPPAISNVIATGITASSATITWTTDQASSSQVNYGTTTGYGSSSVPNTSPVTTHSVVLTGLSANTVYDFDVVSSNSAALSTTSGNNTFTTSGSAPVAPVISNVATSGITSNSVTITWTTDQASSSLVNYGATTAYGTSSTLDTNPVTAHSVTLTGLTAGTTYDFDVFSANAASLSTTSANSSFTTSTASSGTPPSVGYVAYYGITNTGVDISWSTDVNATTQVAYGTTTALGQLTPLQSALSNSHGVVLSNLSPGTTYYFVAQSTSAGGATGYSTQFSFTTTGSNLPVISGVTVMPASGNTASISWTTAAPTYSYVQYGPAAGSYNRYSAQTSLTSTPTCNLPYVPSGVIHYQLISTDPYGNQTMSADATFTEP